MVTPYIHTKQSANKSAYNWLIALCPVFIWSVFAFGARVITLCAVGFVCALILDYPILRYVFKADEGLRIDLMTGVFSVLAVLMMPVTIPLWMPALSSILVVWAKNLFVFRPKRLFNPFVFAVAVINLAFPQIVTVFTKPFAYFSPFSITLDNALVENYRVISPLQYIADGSVYEDGLMAQLYGFASGNMGEIAIVGIILGGLWLIYNKEIDLLTVVALVGVVFALAYINPSDDAESNHYAFSMVLSGAIIFLSVFAFGEKGSVPVSSLGKLICALICGTAIFYTRNSFGGVEWSYCIVLAVNLVSPVIEKFTKPKPVGVKKVKNK